MSAWRSDCGCNGGRQGWNQRWRAPLRAALGSLDRYALVVFVSPNAVDYAFARHGAIFVNFNYRVGALGFMAHPELTREQGGHSGNYGYLDQNAALRWIRANIAAFGGVVEDGVCEGDSHGTEQDQSQDDEESAAIQKVIDSSDSGRASRGRNLFLSNLFLRGWRHNP